jgi:hypothetical protein
MATRYGAWMVYRPVGEGGKRKDERDTNTIEHKYPVWTMADDWPRAAL